MTVWGRFIPVLTERLRLLLRLRRRSEFDAVFAYDCGASGGLFAVRGMPNGLPRPRLGIIAGRKAMPRAVDRNRGKRLVREVFLSSERQLGALDVVVQLRKGLLKADNAAARGELAGLFARLVDCHEPRGAPHR